ncbi:DNA polymerase/3'-5' exonuclease PolX [Candidatus Woesearchaeota archaeon]|nr:DNA polymerase/3'-5' exonuclease PolX [Candidatus Woesearchaeota archaeon]
MKNQEIAQIFYNIADILEMNNVAWKPIAYRKAARALESLSEPIEDVYKKGGIKSLEEIPGIGEGLAKKIEQYLNTGKIDEYERLKKSVPPGILKIMQIQGIGPKKAKKLYKDLGIKNVNDLENAAKRHKIQTLETFKEKTEENILKGIELLRQKTDRMLLGSALPQAEEIVSILQKISGVEKVQAAGSLRRMRETVGDLDILVASKNSKPVMEAFTKMTSVKRVLAEGETKSAVILKTGLQVDVRVVEPSSFGSALQYFTGNKDHNINLRAIAIKKGFKLSEYGLFTKKDDKLVAGRTEEEVYKRLGLSYIEPELRENTGEIEAAMNGKLPKLVTAGDIKGDLHVHSDYTTDAHNTLKEMAEAAKKIGHEYIAMTNHSGSEKFIHGLDERRLMKSLKEIEKVSKETGIKILTGTEVDIKTDGSMDYSDEILSQLDIVIASVHKKFKMGKQDMTERMLKAVSNDNVDIIGHLTGRLIGQREAYELDFDKIFQACNDSKTVLEINANPERLDLNGALVKEAKGYGIKFAISTDAHSTAHLNAMKLGVAMARRGWCEKESIINTYSLKGLVKNIKGGGKY